MVAQLAIQCMQAFQEETRPVAAQTPAAELFALQPLAVEDLQRQQAISLQGSLQGRMVIQAQVVLEPQQGTVHDRFLVRGGWAL